MNHTQRALSSSPSGECTPTHKPHCRVQDDGGTTSLASSPGKMDEHDWLLYYGDIFKGGISVNSIQPRENHNVLCVPQYFSPKAHTPCRSPPTQSSHESDTAIKKFRLPQNVHHKGEQCLAPPSATVLIYHFPHSQPNDHLRAWQLDATAEKMDQPYG